MGSTTRCERGRTCYRFLNVVDIPYFGFLSRLLLLLKTSTGEAASPLLRQRFALPSILDVVQVASR